MAKSTDNRGFTIVELLVVIVVIGILAAITIVSYSGITARAKTSQAQSNANSVQQVAEIYNQDQSHYPRVSADFVLSTLAAKLPATICIITSAGTGQGCSAPQAALAVGNGQTAVFYQYCGSVAAPTAGNESGGRIQYWDFSTNAVSTNILYVGSGVVAGTPPYSSTCHTYVTPSA